MGAEIPRRSGEEEEEEKEEEEEEEEEEEAWEEEWKEDEEEAGWGRKGEARKKVEMKRKIRRRGEVSTGERG